MNISRNGASWHSKKLALLLDHSHTKHCPISVIVIYPYIVIQFSNSSKCLTLSTKVFGNKKKKKKKKKIIGKQHGSSASPGKDSYIS